MTAPDPKIKLFGTRGSAVAYALRDFLYRSGVPFQWNELTSDEQARTEVHVTGLDDERLPICLFPDGTRLEHPTVRQITEKLGWFRNPSRPEYDLAIYGAGPAGLSAAVYGASEGLKTIVIERSTVGGQASSSPNIENYLGFPKGINGAELAERAREQAGRFGAEILLLREGVRGELVPGKAIGHLADGTRIIARASLCATGVRLPTTKPTERESIGRGRRLLWCRRSEASLCAGEHVVVVGGGNSAGQAAIHFATHASKVTMVIRGDSLKKNISEYLVDRLRATPQIEVLSRTEVTALHGDRALRAITLHE